MQYLVTPVSDHELPSGVNVVIVERQDGPPVLLIKGQQARTWAMMRAWEDSVEPSTVPSILRLVV